MSSFTLFEKYKEEIKMLYAAVVIKVKATILYLP